MKNRPGLKQYIFAALGVVILVLLDQYTKLLAIAHSEPEMVLCHHDRCDPCYCELVLWQNSGRKKISATQNLYDHSDSRSNREFY